jgi:tetratricopeptide (TPR) repeat protein
MNRTTWLLALLALLIAFGVGRLLDRARTQEPRALLASAESLLAVEPVDYTRVLYELNLAIDMLEPGRDLELEQELLEARATAQAQRGIRQAAMRDYRRLIEFNPPHVIDLRLSLARLQLDEQQYEGLAQTVAPILAEQSWHTGAKLLLGLSAQKRSGAVYDPLLKNLANILPPRLYDSAASLAKRARAQVPGAPENSALLNEFNLLIAPELGSIAADRLAELETAGEHLNTARGFFVDALLGYAHVEAAFGLGQIFMDAGREELSVELLLAASLQDQVRNDLSSQQVLARALMRLGRPRTASQVIDRTFPGQINDELVNNFLVEWAAVLYENRDWQRLRVLGRRIGVIYNLQVGQERQQDAGRFYHGSAEFALGNLEAAEAPLSAFARKDALEPQPGSLSNAYLHLAEIARDRGNTDGETAYLTAALAKAPEGAAPAWLRLAELLHEQPSEGLAAVRALAKAMAVDPTLEAQHWPRLTEWGREQLRAAGTDIELLADLLLRQARAFPVDSEELYLLIELAKFHNLRADRFAAHLCLDQIERLVPNLGPALDLRAATYAEQGLLREEIATLLKRAALGSPPDSVRSKLRQHHLHRDLLPEESFKWLELDASHSGVLAFARQSIERGRPDLALSGLEPGLVGSPPPLGAVGLCLAAEAELELRRPFRAIERLKTIDPASPEATTALDLRLRAALALQQADQLLTIIDATLERGSLVAEEAIDLVDKLLAQGQIQAALKVLLALDQTPGSRGADTLLRLGLVTMMADETRQSAEAWDRAEAWFADGTPSLGRLLLAIHGAGWTSLPGLVRSVRSELNGPSSLDLCLLAALEERLDEALELAVKGQAEEPDEPLWELARLVIQNLRADPITPASYLGSEARLATLEFLRGQTETRQDPRQALLVLLCIDRPVFTLLARGLLAERSGSSNLWTEFLLARSDVQRGEVDEARGRVAALTVRFPDFGPAWDLRLRLLEDKHQSVDHPELLNLKAQRAAAVQRQTPASDALSPEPVPSAAELLATATQAEQAGSLDEANEWCRRAIQRYPDQAEVRWFYSRLLTRGGSHTAALTQAQEFASRATDEQLAWHLPDYLELLAKAHQESLLGAPALLLALDGLALRLPQDPLVPLALARHDLRTHRDNPRVGVERAFNRLDKFRRAHADQALDSLRPGASSAWVDLFQLYDPERAEEFVREELLRRPEDLDLWLMLGRCFEAQRRFKVALDHYDRIRSMLPDPRAIVRSAEILAELGLDHNRLVADIALLVKLDKLVPEAPRPRFLLGKSSVYGRLGVSDEGLQILGGLWSEREAIAAVVPSADLALVYGSALLRRGLPEDQALIESVLDVGLELEKDPMRKDLLRALHNLSRWLPNIPKAAAG